MNTLRPTQKFSLLVHIYKEDRFIGQAIPEIETYNFESLQRIVVEANLNPSDASAFPSMLQSLRDGYGAGSTVRVMQIMTQVILKNPE
ncbi:MAG: hypothetical protein V4467_04885 [Patescibacteria group bacterium]